MRPDRVGASSLGPRRGEKARLHRRRERGGNLRSAVGETIGSPNLTIRGKKRGSKSKPEASQVKKEKKGDSPLLFKRRNVRTSSHYFTGKKRKGLRRHPLLRKKKGKCLMTSGRKTVTAGGDNTLLRAEKENPGPDQSTEREGRGKTTHPPTKTKPNHTKLGQGIYFYSTTARGKGHFSS